MAVSDHFCIFISMKDSELVEYLQEQNATLLGTLESQAKTIERLSQEVKSLKKLLLEHGDAAGKLKRLANINLPKKTEKRKNLSSPAEKRHLRQHLKKEVTMEPKENLTIILKK